MTDRIILLVTTDGYRIDYTRYPSLDAAKAAMEEAYEQSKPSEWGEEWEDMSYLSDEGAILYTNGENVYVWTIIQESLAKSEP